MHMNAYWKMCSVLSHNEMNSVMSVRLDEKNPPETKKTLFNCLHMLSRTPSDFDM